MSLGGSLGLYQKASKRETEFEAAEATTKKYLNPNGLLFGRLSGLKSA